MPEKENLTNYQNNSKKNLKETKKEENIKNSPLSSSQKNEVNIAKKTSTNNQQLPPAPPTLKKNFSPKDIKWEDEEAGFSPTNGIFFFIRFLTAEEDPKKHLKYGDFYYELAENIPFTYLENLKIKDIGVLQGTLTLTGDSYVLENIIIKFMAAYDYYSNVEATKDKIVVAPHFLIRFGWIGTNNPEYTMQEDEWIECNLTGTIPQLQYSENNTVSVTINFYSTNANYQKLEVYCKNDKITKKGNMLEIFENIFLMKTNEKNKEIVTELKNIYKQNKIKFFIDEEIFNDMKNFINGKKHLYSYTKVDNNVTYISSWSLKKNLEDKDIEHRLFALFEKMVQEFPKLLVVEEKQEEKNGTIKKVRTTVEYNWNYKTFPYTIGKEVWTAVIVYNEYRKEYIPKEIENTIKLKHIKGYRFTNTSRSMLLNFNVDLSNIFYQYMGNKFVELNRENILTTTSLNNEKSDSDLLAYAKLKKDATPPFLTGSINVIGSFFWLSFPRKVANHYDVYNTPIYIDIKNRFGKKSIVSLIYIATTTEHSISSNNWTVTINIMSDTTKPLNFNLE